MIAYEDVTVSAPLTVGDAGANGIVPRPSKCNEGNYIAKQLVEAWPASSWANGAVVAMAKSGAWNQMYLATTQSQIYSLTVRFYYLDATA